MNKVMLFGRLTRDPELRYTSNEMAICNFSIAVRKNKEESSFFNLVSFGKTAEVITKYFEKGNQILVNGRLENNNYEKDGKKVYQLQVVVDSFYFVDKREKEEKKNENDDELPF